MTSFLEMSKQIRELESVSYEDEIQRVLQQQQKNWFGAHNAKIVMEALKDSETAVIHKFNIVLTKG